MEETRPTNDQQIRHLCNEEIYFSLIEQRYFDLGYELLETYGAVQHV